MKTLLPALLRRSTVCALTAGALLTVAIPVQSQAGERQRLDGSWRFELDPQNAGVQQRWFNRALSGSAKLPGSLPAQGIGEKVSLQTKWTGGIQEPNWFTNPIYTPYTSPNNFKFPFWLQPERYYAGAAWFQRDIEVPQAWKGMRVVLNLERPHWETTVWLDDRQVGSNRNLSAPHRYELGVDLPPGKHRLTVRVDNSRVVDVGENSHCISDHTQGNWNGIVGDVWLETTPLVWLQDLQVYPHLATKSATVRGRIGNASGQDGSTTLTLRLDENIERGNLVPRPLATYPVRWDRTGGVFEVEFPMDGASTWDEFQPTVYHLVALLGKGEHTQSVQFGFREITTEGTQLLINGRPLFIRGTLECCIFPLTGHPPTDVKSWTRILKIARAHGLNLLRFHSYCPPEAAFAAADTLGFYFQIETSWANGSTTIGDGKPVDQWTYDETDSILAAFGNHPSFILMPYGNEPGGKNANAYLAKYVSHYKAKDPRRLWTSGSGWPQLPENQFHVTPDPRIQAWGEGLKSRINSKPPETMTDYRDYIRQRSVPVISHEIGQWCVYPNFDEIPKYKGYLKPKNFEIFRDTLKAHGMADLARPFLIASGKLQTLCYKEDIESALRTPGMGGFQLLDLHDFPGQGTALVGVLDPFWDSKGYVTAEEYRRFCNTTVPLARLPKRVFTSDEQLVADLEVAHFGPKPLNDAVLAWELQDTKGRVVAEGKCAAADIRLGNGQKLGQAKVTLLELPAPARYRLVAKLEKTDFENDWDIWVYPARVESTPSQDVLVTGKLDASALAQLARGGKVLLTTPGNQVKGDSLGPVALGFSSIFWNTAWTHRQAPHTLGILCDPKNPAFASFPTEFHSNWQWWYIVSHAGAMILDDLPTELRPTVQIIDDWVTNRKLGLLFEAKVGRGKLMVCSIDLPAEAPNNLVARQLLRSVLNYMAGSRFKPAVKVDPEQIRNLFTDER